MIARIRKSIEEKDEAGNATEGDVHLADTRNALVLAQSRLVACVGMEDVVVIETPDAVMVAKKDKAQAVGKLVAERAKAAGISKVVFDRGGYLYHGRIKALADGAREGGLDF